MDESSEAIGFLAADGVLYCSRSCAFFKGQVAGYEVDGDEYESLVEGGSLPSAAICPACGSEFAVSWPEEPPN